MGKSRFYSSAHGVTAIGGITTEATRGGQAGISAHVRGWNSGIKVVGYIDSENSDCFAVYITAGSNGGANDKLVGQLVNEEWFPND
jgi:hypothetical protein